MSLAEQIYDYMVKSGEAETGIHELMRAFGINELDELMPDLHRLENEGRIEIVKRMVPVLGTLEKAYKPTGCRLI